MSTLVLRPDGGVDKAAAKEVGTWLRDAGAVMRAHAMGLPSPDLDDPLRRVLRGRRRCTLRCGQRREGRLRGAR